MITWGNITRENFVKVSDFQIILKFFSLKPIVKSEGKKNNFTACFSCSMKISEAIL